MIPRAGVIIALRVSLIDWLRYPVGWLTTKPGLGYLESLLL